MLIFIIKIVLVKFLLFYFFHIYKAWEIENRPNSAGDNFVFLIFFVNFTCENEDFTFVAHIFYFILFFVRTSSGAIGNSTSGDSDGHLCKELFILFF